MLGLTTSQSVSVVFIVASIVLYFAANSGIMQNAFIYVFSIALVVLIVDCLFMNDKTFDYEPHYETWSKRQEAS